MAKKIIGNAVAFTLFTGLGISLALAGGLSGEVARNAMCEDVFNQCMEKVKDNIPCSDEGSRLCKDNRYAAEKQCRFLNSHCRDEQPVKRIKPVFPNKEKKEN